MLPNTNHKPAELSDNAVFFALKRQLKQQPNTASGSLDAVN